MKTTLILDDDVAAFLREQAQLHDKPFRQVVNETLRRSMPPAAGQPPSDGEPPRQPYRVPTFSSGYAPGIDPRDPKAFKKLLDQLDIEHFREVQGRSASGDE